MERVELEERAVRATVGLTLEVSLPLSLRRTPVLDGSSGARQRPVCPAGRAILFLGGELLCFRQTILLTCRAQGGEPRYMAN